jgi:hypothetical protein
VVALALPAQSTQPVEQFTATALTRASSAVRTSIEIDIHRWSDQSKATNWLRPFRRSGVEAALRELAGHPSVRQLRSISGLSRTIRYARDSRFTGGSRYFLLLVDPFTSEEFFQGTTSPGGELAAIAIWLGKIGEGEGQIAEGSRIGIDAFGAVTVDVREPIIVLPTVGRPR